MLKKKTFIIALVIFSTFITLLLAEAVYRTYLIVAFHHKYKSAQGLAQGPFNYFDRSLVLFSEKYGFTYNTGNLVDEAHFDKGKIVGCSQFDINKYGSFEKDPPDYNSGELKILIFGDSFTSIPWKGETWASLFTKNLSARLHKKVTSINFGRDGYGVLQMFDLAKDQIQIYKPDLVIFALITDDLGRKRFWRKVVDNGHTSAWYITTEPSQDPLRTDAPLVQVSDDRVNHEWCKRTQDAGGVDALTEDLSKNYEKLMEVELNKNLPTFWAVRSYLLNRILYGEPVLRPTRMVGEVDYLQDQRFLDDVQSIDKTGIPFYLVHIPTKTEIVKGQKWLPSAFQTKLAEGVKGIVKKDFLFSYDYLHLTSEELEKLPMSKTDEHPSIDGIGYYAKAIADLFIDKIYQRNDKDAVGLKTSKLY